MFEPSTVHNLIQADKGTKLLIPLLPAKHPKIVKKIAKSVSERLFLAPSPKKYQITTTICHRILHYVLVY